MPDRLTASIRRLQIDLDSADNALAMLRQLRAEEADAAERGRWLDAIHEAKTDAVLLVERGIGAALGPAVDTAPERWALDLLCLLDRAASLGDCYADPALDRGDFRREDAELRRELGERSRVLGQLPAVLRGSGAALAGRHSAPTEQAPAAPPPAERLSDAEQMALGAIDALARDGKLTRSADIARETGYSSGHVRNILGPLVQREILVKTSNGYRRSLTAPRARMR
jgi:hypothetical protein